MAPSAAELRFRELCNDHAAVARFDLGAQTSLVARDSSGAVTAAEVIDASGARLDPPIATAALVAARARAMREAELATDHLRASLQVRHAAGEELNLAQLARDVGIARSTLYVWLGETEAAAA